MLCYIFKYIEFLSTVLKAFFIMHLYCCFYIELSCVFLSLNIFKYPRVESRWSEYMLPFLSCSNLYMWFRVPLACLYILCTDVIWPATFMTQIQEIRFINMRSIDTTCSSRVALVSLLVSEGSICIFSVVRRLWILPKFPHGY